MNDSYEQSGASCGNYHTVEIADHTMTFREVRIEDLTPTGAQIAVAAGFKAAENVTVLSVLPNGDMEDIRPTEVADLRRVPGRFVVVETDRSYRFVIDGQRIDWPVRIVSGGLLRKLGQIAEDNELFLSSRAYLIESWMTTIWSISMLLVSNRLLPGRRLGS